MNAILLCSGRQVSSFGGMKDVIAHEIMLFIKLRPSNGQSHSCLDKIVASLPQSSVIATAPCLLSALERVVSSLERKTTAILERMIETKRLKPAYLVCDGR